MPSDVSNSQFMRAATMRDTASSASIPNIIRSVGSSESPSPRFSRHNCVGDDHDVMPMIIGMSDAPMPFLRHCSHCSRSVILHTPRRTHCSSRTGPSDLQ